MEEWDTTQTVLWVVFLLSDCIAHQSSDTTWQILKDRASLLPQVTSRCLRRVRKDVGVCPLHTDVLHSNFRSVKSFIRKESFLFQVSHFVEEN